jgi:hypothetical protein
MAHLHKGIIWSLVMVIYLFKRSITPGARSAVREQVFPDYPKAEFIGLNGAGGLVLAKDIPPNIPSEIRGGMNFIFSKNAFFGMSPACDGVTLTSVDLTDNRE